MLVSYIIRYFSYEIISFNLLHKKFKFLERKRSYLLGNLYYLLIKNKTKQNACTYWLIWQKLTYFVQFIDKMILQDIEWFKDYLFGPSNTKLLLFMYITLNKLSLPVP